MCLHFTGNVLYSLVGLPGQTATAFLLAVPGVTVVCVDILCYCIYLGGPFLTKPPSGESLYMFQSPSASIGLIKIGRFKYAGKLSDQILEVLWVQNFKAAQPWEWI